MSGFISFIICLVLTFIVIGLPIIIYTAVVKPKDPIFTLKQATISGFNLTSDDHLTSFFNVALQANNPNHKLKLNYSHVRISIYKSGQTLAEDALHKFTQRKRTVTLLHSEAVALNVRLKKASAFDIRFESGLGYLDFTVYMTAKFGQQYNLIVSCNAKVNITTPDFFANSPGSSDINKTSEDSFPSVECDVYIYSDNND